MGIILIAVWLLVYGILALVSTDIPKWIVPLAAVIVGLLVLATSWKRTP